MAERKVTVFTGADGNDYDVRDEAAQQSIDSINNGIGSVPSGKTLQGQIDTINNGIGSVPSGKTVEGQISDLETNKVPTTRKVNSKALSSDVNLVGSDIPVSALDNTKLDDAITGLKSAIGTVPTGKTVQGQIEALQTGKADMIVVTDSTPAGVMTFSDGADGQPMKLEVAIDPVQDLHGYDYPWPGGAGRNMIPDGTNTDNGYENNKNIKANGTTGANPNLYISEYFPVTPGETYTYKTSYASYTINFCFYDSEKNFIIGYTYSTTAQQITAPSNAAYVRSSQTKRNDYFSMFEKGDVSHDMEPYSNICPISGWTGAKVTRTGKNLYNPNVTYVTGKYLFANDTVATQAGYQYTQDYIEVEPETTYAFQLNKTSSSTAAIYVNFDDANKAYLDRVKITDGMSDTGVLSGTFTTPANTRYVRFSIPYGTPGNGITDIQLEKSSTVTTYEAFGTTYPISWQTEAGTVYGGMLTVNKDGSGVLVATHSIVDMGDITYAPLTIGSVNAFQFGIDGNVKGNNATEKSYYCTCYRYFYSKRDILETNDCAISEYNLTNSYDICVRDDRYSTASEIKTALAGQKLVFELRTSTPCTLSASQVKSFLGLNNVWADTGNINSVEYSADTKLYIDGKIADAIANILNA